MFLHVRNDESVMKQLDGTTEILTLCSLSQETEKMKTQKIGLRILSNTEYHPSTCAYDT